MSRALTVRPNPNGASLPSSDQILPSEGRILPHIRNVDKAEGKPVPESQVHMTQDRDRGRRREVALSQGRLAACVGPALVLILTLAACGGGNDTPEPAVSSGAGRLVADAAIFLSHVSPDERQCLEDTYPGDDFAQSLQVLTDLMQSRTRATSPAQRSAADIYECIENELAVVRALGRSVLPSVPERATPASLGTAPMPSDLAALQAAFGAMPDAIDGVPRRADLKHEVRYDSDGETRFSLEAGDLADPDYQGRWRAGDSVLSRALIPFGETIALGTDGSLVWVLFSSPIHDTPDSPIVYAISWGEIDGPLFFQAVGQSVEDAERVARLFAQAVQANTPAR